MPNHRELLSKLERSQFMELLEVLGIDPALFSQYASPAERAEPFQKQVALISGLRNLDENEKENWIQGAYLKVMKISISDKAREGLSEVVSLIDDSVTRDSVVNALAPYKNSLAGLGAGITEMWRCKEAHDSLHSISQMTPELLKAANLWTQVEPGSAEKGPRMLDIRRLSTGILHHIRSFTDTVKLLSPPANIIFGQPAELLAMAIKEVKSASSDFENGDPKAPILSIIQPIIRQKPSEIQNLIAQHASALPFNHVIAAIGICDFAAKNETLGAMTALRDDTAEIEKLHHSWQHIDNQVRGMEIPIDNLEKSPSYAKQAALVLKFLRSQLDQVCQGEDQPEINQTILQLADSVSAKLADPDADLWDLRADFIDFQGHVSQCFYATDSSLLSACRDMEPLCDPLLHLVNAL
ncbi:hypothetical protein V2O64_00980 [Verrucomicrobiaceae bacterium 227]